MWPLLGLLAAVGVWMYCTARFPIPLTELEQELMNANDTESPADRAIFRKKPVEVEAMRWDGSYSQALEIISWGGVENFDYHPAVSAPQQNDLQPAPTTPAKFAVITLEGEMTISPNDWVIRGVQGEHYPIKPDILGETYDLVEQFT